MGQAEKSTDDEFDSMWSRFPADEKRLKVLLGRMENYTESMLAWQRASDALVKEFGEVLMHGRDSSGSSDGLSESRCFLEEVHTSLQTAQWSMNRHVEAMAEAWNMDITAPMRDVTLDYCTVLKETNKVRKVALVDTDAYTRKLKAAKERKKPDPELVQKVSTKLHNSSATYESSNTFLKGELHRIESTWSDVIIREVAACARLQSNLFKELAADFASVGACEDKVNKKLELPLKYDKPDSGSSRQNGRRLHSWLINGGEKLAECLEGAYAANNAAVGQENEESAQLRAEPPMPSRALPLLLLQVRPLRELRLRVTLMPLRPAGIG